MARKSAVIAPLVHPSSWDGALKTPRVPASWARPFAAVWYSDRDGAQMQTSAAAIAAATGAGGSSPLRAGGGITIRAGCAPTSSAAAKSAFVIDGAATVSV